MATFQMPCPHCGIICTFGDGTIGKRARCSRCKNTFKITAPSAVASDGADAGRSVIPTGGASEPARTIPPGAGGERRLSGGAPARRIVAVVGGAAEASSDYGTSSAWRVGDVVAGVYEVRGILGEGGMGTVLRVMSQSSSRRGSCCPFASCGISKNLGTPEHVGMSCMPSMLSALLVANQLHVKRRVTTVAGYQFRWSTAFHERTSASLRF